MSDSGRPLDLHQRVVEAKEKGKPGILCEAIPYWQFIQFSADVVDGEVRGSMQFAPHLVGDPTLPALHGGTTGALLESTAVFKLLWEAETVLFPKTINVTVDYLRAGRPEETFAEARITRRGRRVVSVTAEAWQQDRDKPIAFALAHFAIKVEG